MTQASATSPVPRILVRGVNWLGDVVMSLPALKRLVRFYPDHLVDILTQASLAPLYRFIPGIGKIIPLHRSLGILKINEALRTVKLIKKTNYSHCVLFPNSFNAALIPALARIPNRIGFKKDFRSLLLTKGLKPPSDFFEVHHSMHFLNIIKESGLEPRGIWPEETHPLITLSTSQHDEAKNVLQRLTKLDHSNAFIALSPSAAYGPSKKWPIERFKEIALKICALHNHHVVVLGTSADRVEGEALGQCHEKIYDLTGKTTLHELILILSKCFSLLTNDSGAMHLAGALNVKVLALFGSTSPEATRGLGPVSVLYKNVHCSPCFKRKCPGYGMICMHEISVNEVWDVLRSWLPKK